MKPKENIPLVEFECREEPLSPGTSAKPRPALRPRRILSSSPERPALLQDFDCEAIDLPPETRAEPRPPERERRDLTGLHALPGAKQTNASLGVEESGRVNRYELSEEELAILGSLMNTLFRGGQSVLLTEDVIAMDESGVDPDAYIRALEIMLGVRPRNLDAVVIRRLMGAVIGHWIGLKASLGLIDPADTGIAIHHAASQFANAYPLKAIENGEKKSS